MNLLIKYAKWRPNDVTFARLLEGPCKNDYVPNERAVSEGGPCMLGATQWAWLEEQLRVVGLALAVKVIQTPLGIFR